ncbi:MAG TPA: FAD/NAD(P)-binding oxidoreductase [Aliiroseovarius sp.]|nr:FAD/NAD(P)-binding oxidoreductase [Aliiroseovarius sp.]
MGRTAQTPFDVAIIGAGIVGCAMARRFTLDGARVVVLEKAAEVLDGASKANSAILHTGFDAPPGSLEQACIAAGYSEYLDIHADLNLPILKSGAMVLAWDDEQLAALPGLVEKAHKNGVIDVAQISREEVLTREPHLAAHVAGGIEVPREYLIDPWTSAHAYMLQALANGAELRRNCAVTGGTFEGAAWRLETTSGPLHAAHVVTTAGLYGAQVDQALTGRSHFELRPRKGQVVVFDKPASQLAQSVLLPVQTKTTKGVVVFRTIFGNLAVGPTAEEQQSRDEAACDQDALSMLRARGIEMLPELENYEITATYAGLRPASEHQDYQISSDLAPNYISVGAIRSTGLSASLGIARHVAGMIGLSGLKPLQDPALPALNHLSNYHRRDWQRPDHGGIVCHCESVTRREIEAALDGPMAPTTLQGLKRRTRVTMGRCQGFYCLGTLAEITRGRLDPPIGEAAE